MPCSICGAQLNSELMAPFLRYIPVDRDSDKPAIYPGMDGYGLCTKHWPEIRAIYLSEGPEAAVRRAQEMGAVRQA